MSHCSIYNRTFCSLLINNLHVTQMTSFGVLEYSIILFFLGYFFSPLDNVTFAVGSYNEGHVS